MHTSFHATGRWHTAYTPEAFESLIKEVADPGSDRFVQRWERPAEIMPGVILAYRIITPWTTVTSQRRQGDKVFEEIAQPAEGNAVETIIAIVSSNVELNITKGQLLGEIELSDGKRVIAFATEGPMPTLQCPQSPVAGRLVKGRTKDDLKCENLRAIAFADDDRGVPCMIEFVVKPKPQEG